MAHILRIMVLSGCIAFAVMPKAEAQQATPTAKAHNEQIMQLMQEIRDIRQQLKPLRLQLQQLLLQTQKLRDQMRPLEEKMKADQVHVQYLFSNKK